MTFVFAPTTMKDGVETDAGTYFIIDLVNGKVLDVTGTKLPSVWVKHFQVDKAPAIEHALNIKETQAILYPSVNLRDLVKFIKCNNDVAENKPIDGLYIIFGTYKDHETIKVGGSIINVSKKLTLIITFSHPVASGKRSISGNTINEMVELEAIDLLEPSADAAVDSGNDNDTGNPCPPPNPPPKCPGITLP